jgi:hypothetical protein
MQTSRRVESLAKVSTLDKASNDLTDDEHGVLAQVILKTEPAEIRRLQESQPALVREWVGILKSQQLADTSVSVAALNHIRFATMSPLMFAAE